MESTLKFNLNDFDDRMAHLRCVKSMDMSLTLFDISNLFKVLENEIEVREYAEQPPMTNEEVIEWFRVTIFEVMNNYNINLDELIT